MFELFLNRMSTAEFERLKNYIKSRDRRNVSAMCTKYKYHIAHDGKSDLSFEFFEEDTLSMALIPEDVPKINDHTVIALKSTGDGNCLYNSASILITGNIIKQLQNYMPVKHLILWRNFILRISQFLC